MNRAGDPARRKAAFRYCREFVREQDRDAYLATLLAPHDAQPRLFAIWAIAADALRLPWSATEPAMAMIRLQWWRDALDGGEGHPALMLLDERDREPLTEFLDAAERLHGAPFAGAEEARSWGGAAFSPLMTALAGRADKDFAAAHGLVFLLRRAAFARKSGLPLIADEEAARRIIRSAAALMDAARPSWSPALLPFSLSRRWLKAIRKDARGITRSTPRLPQPRRQLYLLSRLLVRRP